MIFVFAVGKYVNGKIIITNHREMTQHENREVASKTTGEIFHRTL